MFSQQHYEALAKLFREERLSMTASNMPEAIREQRELALGNFQLRLQMFLKKDNPKFKELLFIGAASEHAPQTGR